ncbi:hypothetical protein GCM10009838_47990 [Catenulispora subtropica]|uniref:Secreted protein n=1 Tax=Catenulispora subtropica TaxID=450798 RepID=A0ABN2S6D5_9ACTN
MPAAAAAAFGLAAAAWPVTVMVTASTPAANRASRVLIPFIKPPVLRWVIGRVHYRLEAVAWQYEDCERSSATGLVSEESTRQDGTDSRQTGHVRRVIFIRRC